MIKRFVFGKAFDTEAVKDKPEACKEKIPYFENAETSSFSLEMDSSDIVYGLGENVRGINKRGFIYESFCTDQPEHNENKSSLYAAHNFFIVSGNKKISEHSLTVLEKLHLTLELQAIQLLKFL